MEENLILVPLITLGAVVRIKPGTRFYGMGSGNPKDMPGKLVEGESAWLSVQWENGRHNNYEEHDLIFDRPFDMCEINSNNIFFEDPVEIKSMDDLLNTLYPKDKQGYPVETFYKAIATGDLLQQCKKNKMRSFDDIWILADTYMPGIDVKDIFKGLLLFGVEDYEIKRNIIRKSFSNCSTMKRIRYTNSFSSIDTALHSIDCNKYDSIYSWRNLFDMIGVKTSSDLLEWYKNELKIVV